MDLFSSGIVIPLTVPFRVPDSHTYEHEWLSGLAAQCFRPEPTEPPWKFACREVWLGGKQAAVPKQYDIRETPWTREWQELPMRKDVRVGCALKSSRTGFTEGSLNILRWMPQNWPGNALYAINSDKLAREVADRRIVPTLPKAFLSKDPDDNTLSRVSMPTMDMLFTGSASSGPFMEMWYRLIILDELENHLQRDNTSTFQRAQSRQADVPDGLILAISKPELKGGIIHVIYVSGSQKKYLVPCPRCERLIELRVDHLMADQCLENDEWDLNRVVTETFYQCQMCQKPIQHHEKRDMVNSDIAKWVPTPAAERERAPDTGKYVPPEPGVESYHISDMYALHERLTWGQMKKMQLLAHVINPSEEAKKYFQINHGGWPWEGTIYSLTDESILALKVRTETEVTKNPDGTEKRTIKLVAPNVLIYTMDGKRRQDPRFYLAYRDGQKQAPLPFKPLQLMATVDKQDTFLQYVVFAWMWNSEAFLIDLGKLQDEDQLDVIRTRPYLIESRKDPMYIHGGLIDSGHRPHEVYRACLKYHEKHRWQMWPARGEGLKEEYKGKLFRYRTDYVDGKQIVVRQFYDHGIKNEFYLNHVQQRAEPRLWLPEDLPSHAVSQLLAEKYNETEKVWDHNKTKMGPNDIGDCCKLQYVIKQENYEAWRRLKP